MNIYKKLGLLSIIFVFALVLSGCKKGSSQVNTPPASENSTETQTPPQEGDEVVYGAEGFGPATITAKAGSTVIFRNSSGGQLDLASDPHPTHTSYPALNIGLIADGEGTELTFPDAGTYKFHNHVNPAHKGTVVIE